MPDLSVYSEAAALYRPAKVKLLWIGESPPRVQEGEEPRYFYFETLSGRDSFFREVVKAMFGWGAVPGTGRSKVNALRRFRDAGAFLIDLCNAPGYASFSDWWPIVQQEIVDLNPETILAAGASVCRFAYPRLYEMGLGDRLLTTEIVPFPGNGWQSEFHAIVDPLVRPLTRYNQAPTHATGPGRS